MSQAPTIWQHIDQALAFNPQFKSQLNQRDENGFTPLMKAAQKAKLVFFKSMLEVCEKEHLDAFNKKDGFSTVLHYVAIRGDNDILKCLVAKMKEKKANLDPQNSQGKTPMMIYVDKALYNKQDESGQKKVPKSNDSVSEIAGDVVFETRSSIPKIEEWEKLILEDSEAIVHYVVKNPDVLTQRNAEGLTPLLLAAKQKCKSSFLSLMNLNNLVQDIHLEASNPYDKNTIFHYLALGRSYELMRFFVITLELNEINLNPLNNDRQTPLDLFYKSNDKSKEFEGVVELARKCGAKRASELTSVEVTTSSQLPFGTVSSSSDPNMADKIKILHKDSEKERARLREEIDRQLPTLIHHPEWESIIESCNIEKVMNYFKQNPKKLKERNEDGLTPLMFALSLGHNESSTSIIWCQHLSKEDVEAVNIHCYNYSVLHYAVQTDSTDVCHVFLLKLLELKGNINPLTNLEMTPYDLLLERIQREPGKEKFYRQIIDIFKSHGGKKFQDLSVNATEKPKIVEPKEHKKSASKSDSTEARLGVPEWSRLIVTGEFHDFFKNNPKILKECNSAGYTPLMLAAKMKHKKYLEAFLARATYEDFHAINEKDNNKKSWDYLWLGLDKSNSVHMALHNTFFDAMNHAAKVHNKTGNFSNAPIPAKKTELNTEFHKAVIADNRDKMVELAEKENRNGLDKDGKTALDYVTNAKMERKLREFGCKKASELSGDMNKKDEVPITKYLGPSNEQIREKLKTYSSPNFSSLDDSEKVMILEWIEFTFFTGERGFDRDKYYAFLKNKFNIDESEEQRIIGTNID